MTDTPKPSPPPPSAGIRLIGLGTDIVEVVRIGQMIERHGEVFLHRVFTEDEVQYCQRRKEYAQHFAGRWAAKEAVMKTLGTGWAKGVSFRDIEVCTSRSGQPSIALHGQTREIALALGIDQILITISHCRAYATATAVAIADLPA
jgi:holo-[acyl-carrier protein] synthase